LNTNRIGKIYQVLIDRREGEYFIGRSEFESPEVDGEILIPYNKNIRKGNFYKVLITECEAFDLFGEIQE
jgi:ribosomal protein S12 methylthiotransferase